MSAEISVPVLFLDDEPAVAIPNLPQRPAPTITVASLVVAHNLPSQPTPFFSRERELAQLAALLVDPGARLITIVGREAWAKPGRPWLGS